MQYNEILREYDEHMTDMQRRILDVLGQATPNAVSRPRLAVLVCGGSEPADISRDVRDRKVREAIADLRSLGVPIVATSGGAGYKLAATAGEMDGMLRENASRRAQLTTQYESMLRMRAQLVAAGRTPDVDLSASAKQLGIWRE